MARRMRNKPSQRAELARRFGVEDWFCSGMKKRLARNEVRSKEMLTLYGFIEEECYEPLVRAWETALPPKLILTQGLYRLEDLPNVESRWPWCRHAMAEGFQRVVYLESQEGSNRLNRLHHRNQLALPFE